MSCIFRVNGSRRGWSLHKSLGLTFHFRSSKTFTLNLARSPPLLNNNAGSSSASLYNPEDLSPFVGIDLWTPAASKKVVYNVAEWARQNFSLFFVCLFVFKRYLTQIMLKILQARLQQYVNRELPDVQVGFRKGRGTRDQIANIRWIIKKAREFQKNIYFCSIDYAKAFDCVDHNKLWKNPERDGNTRPPDLPLEKSVCRPRSNS